MSDYTTINDWIVSPFAGEKAVKIGEETRYYFIRIVADVVLLIPFLLLVLLGRAGRLFRKKNGRPSMFFGTHPVVTHMQNKKVLESEYDCTLFVFEDWSGGKMHDGLTLHSIMPSFLIGKNPYLFGSYWTMLWILNRFDVVHLYFDGGALERTLWWRIEPWLYQWYGIKMFMYPYGADVMRVSGNPNRMQRVGHMHFRRRYFLLDPKREVRNFWWSKYADLIFGYASYIDFLPRLDVLTWHGHIVEDVESAPFPSVDEGVRIVHYASHGVRKSSGFICSRLKQLTERYPNLSIECLSGLPRDEAIAKLESAHIFVDSLNDGYLQYSSIEAMLKGRVVLSSFDSSLAAFFTQLYPDRYESFFEEMPLIRIEPATMIDTVARLLEQPERLAEISEKNRIFANKLICENREAYRKIIEMELR